MNYAAPQGVNIGGTFSNMEDVRRCGVQSLIDGSPGCAVAPEKCATYTRPSANPGGNS
jgi:hypothetical protein